MFWRGMEETNSLRIHPSMDNNILNINAAQIIKDKADQIADNGVVHFVDEVCTYVYDFPPFQKWNCPHSSKSYWVKLCQTESNLVFENTLVQGALVKLLVF